MKEHWRGQQRFIFDPYIGPQKIDGKAQPFFRLGPSFPEPFHRRGGHAVKQALLRGEDDDGADKLPKVYGEPALLALLLKRLQFLQQVLPPGGYLREGEVRRAELGPQRIHAHENLRHLLVAHCPL